MEASERANKSVHERSGRINSTIIKFEVHARISSAMQHPRMNSFVKKYIILLYRNQYKKFFKCKKAIVNVLLSLFLLKSWQTRTEKIIFLNNEVGAWLYCGSCDVNYSTSVKKLNM